MAEQVLGETRRRVAVGLFVAGGLVAVGASAWAGVRGGLGVDCLSMCEDPIYERAVVGYVLGLGATAGGAALLAAWRLMRLARADVSVWLAAALLLAAAVGKGIVMLTVVLDYPWLPFLLAALIGLVAAHLASRSQASRAFGLAGSLVGVLALGLISPLFVWVIGLGLRGGL